MSKKRAATTSSRTCDCDGCFAGSPAGLPYWDGDSLQVLEFPVGGGPYMLVWRDGVPVWVNMA